MQALAPLTIQHHLATVRAAAETPSFHYRAFETALSTYQGDVAAAGLPAATVMELCRLARTLPQQERAHSSVREGFFTHLERLRLWPHAGQSDADFSAELSSTAAQVAGGDLLCSVSKYLFLTPSALSSPAYMVKGRKIGNGGFGRVYHAQNTEFDEPVAIKIYRRLLNNYAALPHGGLWRELSYQGTGNRPYLVDVHHAGLRPSGRPYLSMEYMAGGTVYQQRPAILAWPIDQKMRLAQKMIHVVSALHAAGIIHYDLSPSQFLFANDDFWTSPVKITDCGLSQRPETDCDVTALMGRKLYWSPERFMSARSHYTADVYALGQILRWMLGELDIDDEEHPRFFIFNETREPLPDLLRPILTCATARDPAARYPSAVPMLADFMAATE